MSSAAMRQAIEAAIAAGPRAYRADRASEMMGDAVSVSVGGGPRRRRPSKATLWLVLYERHVRVPVGRGENRNRTLDYYNVVRKLRPIAVWRGEPIKVDLPMGEYQQSNADGCAILLQEEAPTAAPARSSAPLTSRARKADGEGLSPAQMSQRGGHVLKTRLIASGFRRRPAPPRPAAAGRKRRR